MATLTIRNLDDTIKTKLHLEAAKHGLSMEEEARRILKQHLTISAHKEGMGTRLHQRFAAVNGVELELPARKPARQVNFK